MVYNYCFVVVSKLADELFFTSPMQNGRASLMGYVTGTS
jgi:hypothetical protein